MHALRAWAGSRAEFWCCTKQVVRGVYLNLCMVSVLETECCTFYVYIDARVFIYGVRSIEYSSDNSQNRLFDNYQT